MNFGVHPIVLIAGVGGFLGLVTIIVACRTRSGVVRALTSVLAFVFLVPGIFLFLAFRPELVDGRFRTYKTFYQDIQIGMTREQVYSALERRYPKGGPRQRPTVLNDTPEGLGFFMNPETSREPNCEGIFLKLERNRVIKKDYSPD